LLSDLPGFYLDILQAPEVHVSLISCFEDVGQRMKYAERSTWKRWIGAGG